MALEIDMDEPIEVIPICNCGRQAEGITSWTVKNPGRRFFGCPLRRKWMGRRTDDYGCRFFARIDLPIDSRSDLVVNRLLNQIEEEKAKVARLKKLKIALAVIVVICLVIIF